MQKIKFTPFIVGALASVSIAQAAVIDGSAATTTQSTTWDLSSMGAVDWVYWNGGSISGGTPTNSKFGATLLGDAYILGSGTLAGSGTANNTNAKFTFSDGDNPASGTLISTALFSNDFTTNGAGVGFDITLPTTDTYEINVFMSGYFQHDQGTRGLFTASMSGATDYQDSSLVANVSVPKKSIVYTLLVTPDNPGDTLSLTTELASVAGSNSIQHVIMNGITVSQVPEPSTYAALAGLVVLGIAAARRRRQK